MRKNEVAEIITAAGLNPANYRTARAAAIINASVEAAASDGGDVEPLLMADIWETLGGNQDEDGKAPIPKTQEAADAAWDVADSLTEANGFGGAWAA